MTSAFVELNQPTRSESSLANSKSTRPHNAQMIDSVPVDNPSADKDKEVAVVKCNHFSIRGYVSEMRKKNPKLCDPFTPYDCPDGDSNEPARHELPPMVVPKFRWWQCDSCVGGGSSETAKDSHKSADVAHAPMLLIEAPRERKLEASTSSDSNDNKNYGPLNILCDDPKGKRKAHVEDEFAPNTGCENGFLKDSSSQGILQQNRSSDKEGVVRSRCNENGIIGSNHKTRRLQRIEERSTPEEHMNCDDENVDDACQHKTRANGMVSEAVAGIVDGPGPSGDGKGRVVPLPDLNECNRELSEEDDDHHEVLVTGTDNLCEEDDDDDDDYLGADHRKVPKVRLLSELLALKEDSSDAKLKKNIPSFACKSTVSDLDQRQSPMRETVKRKRFCSLDEEIRSIEISESDSEDKSTDIVSETNLVKRHSNKSTTTTTMDNSNPLLEKKNKKIKIDHGSSSSMSRPLKILPKSTHEKGKSTVDAIKFKPCHSVQPNRVIDLPPNERKSVLTNKKKGKMVHNPREFSTTKKGEEFMKNSTDIIQKIPSQDGTRFPNSYLTVGNDQIRAPPLKDGFHTPSSWADPILLDGGVVRKNRNIGESSTAFRSTGSKFDGNSKGKQVWIPNDEEGVSRAQKNAIQVTNSVMNQKVLSSEVRRNVQDIDINSIPMEPEQGSGDDIPMDIVELMAKNQYERHLGDPNNNRSPVIPANYSKNVRSNGTNGAYGEHMPKFGQSHFLSMQKPPLSTHPRNTIVYGFDDVASSKQKFLGPFSEFNRNQPSVRGHPRENTYSSLGLSPNNWNHINMAAQRGFPSFLQDNGFRASSSSRSNNEARVWPPMMASRMPVGITNPEMIAQSSNTRRIHHQSPGMFNFSGGNLGKSLNFSNSYEKVVDYPPKPMGSVDLYSNEAIPAMHLLSLMQNAARMQPRPPILADHSTNSSSRQPLNDTNVRTHPCFPSARPLASSFRNNGGVGGNSGFISPIPLTSRGQRNIENTHHFVSSGGDIRPQKRQLASSAINKGKGIVGMSNPYPTNHPSPVMKDSSRDFYGPGTRQVEKTIRSIPKEEVCMVNQNPSEFNDLTKLGQYMIGPEDLRPKGSMGRERSARPRGDVKRQEARTKKATSSGKERNQLRKS